MADTLSELEQQVERCWIQHAPPIVSILLIMLAALFAIVMSLEPRLATNETAHNLERQCGSTPEDIAPYREKTFESRHAFGG